MTPNPLINFALMKTVLLKFNLLSNLSSFCKQVQPATYIINTGPLTLSATLTEFELALAIEQFGAAVVNKHAAA